jgi:hypothetical protein
VNNSARWELTQMPAMTGWGRCPPSLGELTAGQHHGTDSCHEDACHDGRDQPSQAAGDGVSSKGQRRGKAISI